MSDISVVTVTGASGFIGSHIVKACLERGFTVHACVRDKDAPKNAFLTELAGEVGGGGRVVLFSADLTTPGAYDEAVMGADAVIHAAAQVGRCWLASWLRQQHRGQWAVAACPLLLLIVRWPRVAYMVWHDRWTPA
jgi:nucleoside-diphosphate-sugar epimerase